MYIRRGSYGGHLIARSPSPASSKLVGLVFTLTTWVYKLHKLRWPFAQGSLDSYSPSLLGYISCKNYGAHLMVRHCPLQSQGSLGSYSPSLLGYISCKDYGGRLFVRSLSPAGSRLVGLVFTLATWVYQLQKLRCPFDGSPLSPAVSSCKNYGAHLMVRHCPLQSQGSLDSYSPSLLGYISCKDYGAHLMVRHCPLQSQGSLDSYSPSLLGYISCKDYGGRLFVRSLSPAVSSCKDYGGRLFVRSLSPAGSRLVGLVFTLATWVYQLQKLRCPFDGSPLSPAVSRLVGLVFTLATWVYQLQKLRCPFDGSPLSPAVSSCKDYGAHLMVRHCPLQSQALNELVGLVFTLTTQVYKLHKLRCPFDGSPLSPAVSSCKDYGGRLFVRSLSPAGSRLVRLVFTLATRAYKLQRLRCPFDGSPLSPAVSRYTSCTNYGAHLMVRHCPLQSQALNGLVGLVFTLTTQVYKLHKLRCPFDGSPLSPAGSSCKDYGGRLFVRSLSPAGSRLVRLVFTLATRAYKLQRLRCPFDGSPLSPAVSSCKNYGAHLMVRHCPLQSQGSLDSYSPSLLGYISCKDYGGRLFVRSLSPAVSSCKDYGAHLMVRHCPLQSQGSLDSYSPSLLGYISCKDYGGRLFVRSLSPAVSSCKDYGAHLMVRHCPLQSQGSLDSYSPSLLGYTSCTNYGGRLFVRSLSPAGSSCKDYGAHLMVRHCPLQSQGSLDSYSPSLLGYISCKDYGGRLFVRSLSPAGSSCKDYGAHLMVRHCPLQSQAAKTTVAVCLFAHCPLQAQGSFDSYLPSLPGHINCKDYGAHLMVRHCPLQSQALNGLVGLVFTLATWVYQLQKLRCPFDGSPLSPAVSRLVGLVFNLTTQVYKLHKLRCPFDGSPLSPAVSRLAGLVLTLATRVYKLQTISLRPYWSIVIPRLIITLSSNNNNSPRSAGLLLVQDHHLLALKHHQRTPKNLCVLKQVLMSNCNLAHNQFGNSGYSSAWTSIPGANKDRPSFIADAATTTA
ncbi:hypothetical protein C8J55DRAFT_489429 [Lentinula edodes]|uniref:Uncharacterized protein n=1 Tax=Lentinula lateritia TaxID=40482 RepID=A0A9W9ADV9_9AGAR|nr:hypothetical protein C8J55DRAFT_489429 [Lentinula edodes]